jgi:hypothetical protein
MDNPDFVIFENTLSSNYFDIKNSKIIRKIKIFRF